MNNHTQRYNRGGGGGNWPGNNRGGGRGGGNRGNWRGGGGHNRHNGYNRGGGGYNNRNQGFNNRNNHGGYNNRNHNNPNNQNNTQGGNLNRSLPNNTGSSKSDSSRLNQSDIEPVSGSFKKTAPNKDGQGKVPTSLVNYEGSDDEDEDGLKIYEGSTEEEEPESKSESGPVEKEKPKNIETEKKIAVEDYDPIPEPAKIPATKTDKKETDQKEKPKSENKEAVTTKPADKKSDKTNSPKKPETKSKTVEKNKVEVVPPKPLIKSILKSSKPEESKSPISSTPVKSSDKSDKISEKSSSKAIEKTSTPVSKPKEKLSEKTSSDLGEKPKKVPEVSKKPIKEKETKTDSPKLTSEKTTTKEKSEKITGPENKISKPSEGGNSESSDRKQSEKKSSKDNDDEKVILAKDEMIIDDAIILKEQKEQERKEKAELRRGLETMQMLKKLKAENEAKSKEAENSKNSKGSSEKSSAESGLAKTDEKVRKALESSEKKSSSSEKTRSDDISDKTRALLEDKKSKSDSSKSAAAAAAPPPPPPKKPKDLESSSSPDTTTNRARKSVSLGSLIRPRDPTKENGDEKTDKKTENDKPTKRSSSDKRNTNSSSSGKVQSKMTSFVTKDDKKERRDSITTDSFKLGSKPSKTEDESSQRRSSRRKLESTSSSKDSEIKKEKSKSQSVMSEDIFDAEIRKKNQNESDRTKDRAGEKKRPSVVESSDEDQPATKKSRKNSDVSDGLMSPTRRVSTSFSSRHRKNEQKRAAESLARKQSSDLDDEKSDRPSELDLHPSADGSNDFYCWICHKEGEVICCDVCPRVYHESCMPRVRPLSDNKEFFCPECTKVQDAENTDTRVESMKNVSISDLSLMLKNAVETIRPPGVEIFMSPVDTVMNPNYIDYIFHPMDLGTISQKISQREYGSTDAFIADIKWIQHNCIIFNTPDSALSATAKKIVKLAEKECSDIETCPGCYLGPLKSPETNWFTKVCDIIHPIVWGKIAGYPIWPGKAVGYKKEKQSGKIQVDIRFFGQHDRGWVPCTNVYCYTKEEPAPKPKKERKEYDLAISELNEYIFNLKAKHGKLREFLPKTCFDATKNFDLDKIFIDPSGEGKPPSKINEVPKIPPLVKPPNRGNRLPDIIAKAKEMVGPKDKKKIESDDDRSSVGSVNEFDFDEDDTTLGIDLGKDKVLMEPAKRKEKKEPEKKLEISSNRPSKRPRSESPMEAETRLNSESNERRSSRHRTESPRPGAKVSETSEKDKIPPPPPKGAKTKDESLSKNPYSKLENERKRKELELKKTKIDSPKISKTTFRKDSEPSLATDFISDAFNSVPVQGLPPGIPIVNYTNKVMNNITAVFKDVYQEILKSMDGNGHVENLRLEVDRLKWQHEMELNEMRHNHELTIAEIRQSVEREKDNAINDLKTKLEKEKSDAILETKKKQWCANCGKEAVFYCCWNTSYCDYPCQQGHWPVHMASCSQGSAQQGRPT